MLTAATILQDVFNRGRAATWKQPGVLQSVPAVRKQQLSADRLLFVHGLMSLPAPSAPSHPILMS